MNEIERICNSHMSKERKIQELNALKEYANYNINSYDALIKEIDYKIYKIENDIYLEEIIDKNNKINAKLPYKKSVSILTSAMGLLGTKSCIEFASKKSLDNNSLEGFFYALLITALVDTAALITVSSTIKDMYNRKIYNEEISSYQRRLK